MTRLGTTTDGEVEEVAGSAPIVLVKLTADWCGPCRMYNPVLEQLSEDTGIPVFNLDIDHNPNTPRDHLVQSIPTVLVYVEGELRDQLVGARPYAKLRKDLQPWLPA